MNFLRLISHHHRFSRSIIGISVLLLGLSVIISTNNIYTKRPAVANAAASMQTHDFTPVSQSHSSTDYLNLVKQSLVAAEGIRLGVYDDGQGIPTIGIGYNLKVRSILNTVVTNFGADPAKLSTQNQAVLTGYIDQMASSINSFTKGSSIKALQTSLNKQLVQIGTLFATGVVQSVFAFANAANAESLFNTIYNQLSFENSLSSVLGGSNVNDSLERVALLSLAYNGIKIKGTKMLTDIQKNNRAEVWFEIRYGTNATNNALSGRANQKIARGVAIRRNYESDLFGLYDSDPFNTGSPSLVTNAEADQIFNMVLAHETSIFQSVVPIAGKASFNNQYFFNPDTLIATTNKNYANPIGVVKTTSAITTPEPDFTARNLTDDFTPAVNYLLTNSNAVSVGNILVYNQPGSQIQPKIDLTKIGQTTPMAVFLQSNGGINQQVIMNAANDLIYAKSNSTITLGPGVDQLTLQGATYTVDATQITSAKNLPIDTITFAGKPIAGTIPASGVYNGLTYMLNGTTLTITSGNNTLTIKGFTTGNFGVKIGNTPPPPALMVVFNGLDTNGYSELWATDGTAKRTTKLTSVTTGTYRGLVPNDITPFGKQVLFSGTDASGLNELWISNGTITGTTEITSATSLFGDLGPYGITVLGNQAIFAGYDMKGNVGLWVTNGTSAGTHQLLNIANVYMYGLNPTNFAALGKLALFNGYDAKGNKELWVTDGTAPGTKELTTIYTNPRNITTFGNQAVFTGTGTNGLDQLWVTNGILAGTTELNVTNANIGFSPDSFAPFNNEMLFAGFDVGGNRELWVTNGTGAGTNEVTTTTSGFYSQLSPSGITSIGTQAVFQGYDTTGHTQLWVTDGIPGGATTKLTTIVNTFGGLSMSYITAFGNQALFSGFDASGNKELWVTNGTPASTNELTSTPNTDSYNVYSFDITVFGTQAVFNDIDAKGNFNLWVTNGTPNGTHEVIGILNADSSGLNPSYFSVL